MKNLFKKTILGTITLGIILSTVFGPFFSNKALADLEYAFSGKSATENSIIFEVVIKTADPTDLQTINPLKIQYSINQDYSDSQTITVPDFDTTQLTQSRLATAGGLTASTTYYARILNSSLLSLNETTAQTSAPGTTTQDPTGSNSEDSSALPPCSFLDLGGTIDGCIARGFYYVFFVPTSFLFSLSGQLMDFSMAYTLNSANYGKTADGSSFVEKGWTITRDLSNIVFIVMLMYIAINIILGRGADKKLLGTIILVGLLINFSLFFARVIIDASNILGKIFYDNMGVETNSEAYINNPWIGEGDKSISIAIVSNFNPQKLFSQAGTLKLNTTSGVKDTGAPDAGPFIIITLIMSIINLFGMYIFFVVAFILIGRVIGLWLLMIFAPIAFISHIMPASASGVLNKMHHSKWWPELFKQSFVVPIFLFMLYLILLFVNTGFLRGFKTFDNTTTGGILDVIVPLIIITFLLKAAKDIATDMSGDIGKAFASVGSTVGGLALGGVGGLYGKALGGGIGALGRATLGKTGTAISESRFMKNMENRGGFLGGAAAQVRDAGGKIGASSFDVRAIQAVQKASGNRLGQAQKGGFIASRAEQGKRELARARDIATQAPSERVQSNIREARRLLVQRQEDHRPVLTAAETRVTDAQNALAELRELGVPNTDTRWTTAANELAAARRDRRTTRTTYLGAAEANLRAAENTAQDQKAQILRQSARRIEQPNTPRGRSTRGWRRVVTGGEYNQTQAYATADEIRRSIRQPNT